MISSFRLCCFPIGLVPEANTRCCEKKINNRVKRVDRHGQARLIRVTGQNPPDMYPPDTYPKDTYPQVTYPLDTYPLDIYPLGHIPPGHLPPGHLPPGHLPPRTYTPQDIYPQPLKCPIWFMHHVLITYCTLRSIYFAEIAFICDVGAIRLTDICSVRKG